MYGLYACLIIALVQGIQGSVLDIEFDEVDFLDTTDEFDNQSFLTELEQFYDATEHKKNCSELAQGVLAVYDLSHNLTDWAYESMMHLNDDVYTVLQCTVTAQVQCLFDTLQKTRDDALKVLPEFLAYRKEFEALYHRVRNGLKLCFRP
ncbi:uncharacterized protein LOC106662020 [Cimex lectularius]|uniref:Secreted protein n=1 Tax=Cimex lectularius TaxID=79782 RepID=A0A8I6R8N9_CIMLE|nr:uncharacterized protein LOC106662020 [Cimex lectularius]